MAGPWTVIQVERKAPQPCSACRKRRLKEDFVSICRKSLATRPCYCSPGYNLQGEQVCSSDGWYMVCLLRVWTAHLFLHSIRRGWGAAFVQVEAKKDNKLRARPGQQKLKLRHWFERTCNALVAPDE